MRAIDAYWQIRRAYIEQRLPMSSYEDIVKNEVDP